MKCKQIRIYLSSNISNFIVEISNDCEIISKQVILNSNYYRKCFYTNKSDLKITVTPLKVTPTPQTQIFNLCFCNKIVRNFTFAPQTQPQTIQNFRLYDRNYSLPISGTLILQ